MIPIFQRIENTLEKGQNAGNSFEESKIFPLGMGYKVFLTPLFMVNKLRNVCSIYLFVLIQIKNFKEPKVLKKGCNSLPNNKFLDLSKLKAFADDETKRRN